MGTLAPLINDLPEAERDKIQQQTWPKLTVLSRAKIVGPSGGNQAYLFIDEDIHEEWMETGEVFWDRERDPEGLWKVEEKEIRNWDVLGYRSVAEWLIALCAAGWNAQPVSEREARAFFADWAA